MSDNFKKGGKIYEAYQKVYRFHQKYQSISTDEEWETCLAEYRQFTNEFEISLAVVALKKIEDGYNPQPPASPGGN